MGKDSAIAWTHHTFNIVWGCEKVSAACTNCYAETWAKRTGYPNLWGRNGARRTFNEKHWAEPLRWNLAAAAAGERHRVFCSSMADVFEDHPVVASERERLWPLIKATPHLDWLLLTKRPENILPSIPAAWRASPLRNVWYGTTVENQAVLMPRVRALAEVPSPVRFLSMEPLLEYVDLRDALWVGPEGGEYWGDTRQWIQWVIMGCEKVANDRPGRRMDPAWVRGARAQCAQAKVAFLLKQAAVTGRVVSTPGLDGDPCVEYPEVGLVP